MYIRICMLIFCGDFFPKYKFSLLNSQLVSEKKVSGVSQVEIRRHGNEQLFEIRRGRVLPSLKYDSE